MNNFVTAWRSLAQDTLALVHENGFGENTSVTQIALIHSEISEALEALRQPELRADKHCPECLEVEVELADAIIRIMNLAADYGWDVAGAVLAKHEYNKTRPYKHGKKF